MSHFIVADRKTDYLLPPSLDDWLNEDHLARFVVEVVDQLDLSNLTRQYAGRGSKAHHPATLLAILVYGYATGVFSTAGWSERPTIRLPSATLPPAAILTTTPWPPSGGAFSANWKACLRRCWNWPRK